MLSSPEPLWADKTHDDNVESCNVLRTSGETEGGPRPTLRRIQNLRGLVGWASAHLQGPSPVFGDSECDVIGRSESTFHRGGASGVWRAADVGDLAHFSRGGRAALLIFGPRLRAILER